MVSAAIYVPVLILLAVDGALSGLPVLMAIAAGVLSSAVPYAADLTALRFIPQRFFGVFMSVNPVLAALAGMLLLGQDLALHEWLGIAIVVTANVLATLRHRQAR
jgi:inner membrane transporter RhtA